MTCPLTASLHGGTLSWLCQHCGETQDAVEWLERDPHVILASIAGPYVTPGFRQYQKRSTATSKVQDMVYACLVGYYSRQKPDDQPKVEEHKVASQIGVVIAKHLDGTP
jgi:hypothetical protein